MRDTAASSLAGRIALGSLTYFEGALPSNACVKG